MGRRRAKSPFEDNPVIDGFLEWMDAPEGQQSIEALDLVFVALEHAGVDARQRKIVWAAGRGVRCDRNSRAGLAGKLYARSLLRAPPRGTRPAHRTVARRQCAHVTGRQE